MKKKLTYLIILIVYAAMAVGLALIIYSGGNYPTGADTMCHIYKGDVLYNSIKAGNWYPLYDNFWYNGVQMMRYWAPLPVYFIAMCQAMAGGNLLTGYLVFVGIVFFLGAVAWLYIGAKKNRVALGFFMGIVWFFMPNNLFALFVEGNLPRTLSMVLLPLLICFIYEYVFENRWESIRKIIPVFTLISLCHVGYAGMIVLAMLIFLLIYRFVYKTKGRVLNVIISLVLPFLIIGIWMFASLKGGITSTDSSQVMKGFFQNAIYSLNPFLRITEGVEKFYFGLAAFIIAVFGVICSKKKSAVGFASAIVIFICTTTSMYTVLVKLPGSQYLWMLRFISIALCFILMSFMLWDTLKRKFVIICCVLLVLDIVPSLILIYPAGEIKSATQRLNEQSDETLITQARDITRQRAALMDESLLGATGQYLLTDYGDKRVQGTFGAGWQSAATATNIVELNEAMEQGCYLYMFDRALELGNDTVIVNINCLKYKNNDVNAVNIGASKRGYSLVAQNDQYLLYHYDTYDTFGTVTSYDGIGIGDYVQNIVMNNPDIEKAESSNLNDYTFEELSKYKIVYLSGFTYNNQKEAEKLVIKLSESGVKIVICGDGIPTHENTGKQEFLGVTCQKILFENGYPTLYTNEGEVESYLFDRQYRKWKTVYFNGLDKTEGYIYDNGLKLDFLGTKKNENIVFVGLNISFHYALTHDEEVGRILNKYIGQYLKELPDRECVPLSIKNENNRIIIVSKHDNVNTSLAFHDIFYGNKKIDSKNNLMYVDSGTTIVNMKYPYVKEGMALSILGVLLSKIFLVWVRKRNEKEKSIEG